MSDRAALASGNLADRPNRVTAHGSLRQRKNAPGKACGGTAADYNEQDAIRRTGKEKSMNFSGRLCGVSVHR